MLKYKIDVLQSLKEAGYNTNRIRKEKLLCEHAVQSLRRNEMIGITSLNKVCTLLDKQPGDIIAFVK